MNVISLVTGSSSAMNSVTNRFAGVFSTEIHDRETVLSSGVLAATDRDGSVEARHHAGPRPSPCPNVAEGDYHLAVMALDKVVIVPPIS